MSIFRPLLITFILSFAALIAADTTSKIVPFHGNNYDSLFDAVANNNVNYVKELLDKGTNPNFQEYNGKTALMLACELTREYKNSFYFDIVKLLLQYKADPNITDNEGNTALIHAVYIDDKDGNGHGFYTKETCDVVRLLLKNGANPHIKNKTGKSVVDYVTYIYHSPIKHKMENAATTATAFSIGVWPLYHRSSTNSETIKHKRTILKILKKHGVKLNFTRWQELTWRV